MSATETRTALTANAARVLAHAERAICESKAERPMYFAGKKADEEGAQELVAAGYLKPAVSSTGSPMWAFYVKA